MGHVAAHAAGTDLRFERAGGEPGGRDVCHQVAVPIDVTNAALDLAVAALRPFRFSPHGVGDGRPHVCRPLAARQSGSHGSEPVPAVESVARGL